MWNQSSSSTTIPPNLLKNFNPYDILEPQKNGANISDANKVDKLKDIDDSSHDSGYHEPGSNGGLDQNKGFDLVDLYQNILVTPQLVKQSGTASNNIVTNVAPSLDIDFKQFFDKLEAGQKIDWMKIAQSPEETISKRNADDYLEKPRVLVAKVFIETDSESDPEDLIHEVLTQKNLEKIALSEVNRSPIEKSGSSKNVIVSDVTKEFSRLGINNSFNKDSKLESGCKENESNTSEFKSSPIVSQINNLTNFTVQTIQKDPKKKHLVKPEHQKAQFTKGPDFYEKSVVLPQIMARLNARQAYLDEKSNYKKRLVLDAGASTVKAESKSIGDGILKSKINDQRNISVKPENISISKDPKLCINQLTESIAVHNTAKLCTNCSKPSTGIKAKSTINGVNSPITVPDFGKLNPTVLMEDCNKERLRALKQSQMFKDFVLKGKYEI